MGIWSAVAWAGFCVVAFLSREPIPFGTRRIPPAPTLALLTPALLAHAAREAGLVFLFWAAAWRVGSWLTRRLGFEMRGRCDHLLLDLGLGAAALGMAALLLGTSGLLRGWLLSGALALLAAGALPDALSALRRLEFATVWPRVMEGVRANPIPVCAIALAAGYQFLVALGPSVFYDGLVYHLGLPAHYLQKQRLVATPLNVYAGIPAGVEMLYLWLLALGGGGSTAQLLHWSLGLLSAAAVAALGRRLDRLETGLWAAALFLFNPMVLLEMGRPAVELGWSFFLALTFLALESAEDPALARPWVLAGLLAGAAAGTKYQAALLLPAAALYLLRRFGWRDGRRPVALVCGVAAAVAAPWALKNLVFYGNPAFPLLAGALFPSAPGVDLPAFLSSAHGRDLGELMRGGPALSAFLSHPWTYAMPSEGSEADAVMSYSYLALLPVVAASRPPEWARRLLLAAAVLWVPLNLLSGLARFSIPALVPLSLVCAAPLAGLSGLGRRVRGIGAAVLFTLCALYVHSKTDVLLWKVLAGRIPREEFLTHRRPLYPAPPYAAYEWVRANLPADAKLTLVGEPRSFYLARENETASPYASAPLVTRAEEARSGDELGTALRNDGFTHVLLNVAWMGSSRQVMSMSPGALAALRQFWTRNLAAEFVDQSQDPRDLRFTVVYRILSEEDSRLPHPETQFPFEGPGAASISARASER